ncbi:hypothetical protein [Leuconostoc citreum]|uniref:hypothetical protein n=1 Tax=Leuconostoc citreum TaxID=33964 RepID=UPI0032DEEBED
MNLITKFRKSQLLILMAAVLTALAPILIGWHSQTVYSGADMQFHVNRIHELVEQFKSGNLGIIAIHSFDSVGSGVQYFYPNFTLIPAVLIEYILTNSINAYYATLMFYGLLGFFISKYAFNKLLKDDWTSTLSSILYCLAMYNVNSIVAVSAFGEFIATLFIPLVVLGYLNIIKGRGWKTLWIAMVLIGYTHLLSLLLTVLILIIITLGRTIFNPKKFLSEVTDYFKATICFIVSYLAFILPFFILMKENNIVKPFAVIQSQWTHSFAGYFVTSMSLSLDRRLGITLTLVLILIIWKWKRLSKEAKIFFWTGIILVFVGSSDFPWTYLEKTPINIIQFPYRFIPFAVVSLSLAAGLAIRDISCHKDNPTFKKIMVVLISVFSFLSVIYSTQNFKQGADTFYRMETGTDGHLNYNPFANYRVNAHSFEKQYNNQFDTYGAFDYWTIKAYENRNSLLSQNVHADNKTIPSQKLVNKDHVTFVVDHGKQRVIDLPFIKYRGIPYDVRVNGKKTTPLESSRETISVKSSQGRSVITIQPKIPKYVILSWFISIIATVAVLISPLLKKRKS